MPSCEGCGEPLQPHEHRVDSDVWAHVSTGLSHSSSGGKDHWARPVWSKGELLAELLAPHIGAGRIFGTSDEPAVELTGLTEQQEWLVWAAFALICKETPDTYEEWSNS